MDKKAHHCMRLYQIVTHIRILSILERFFQLLQLQGAERGSTASLLSLERQAGLRDVRVGVVVYITCANVDLRV